VAQRYMEEAFMRRQYGHVVVVFLCGLVVCGMPLRSSFGLVIASDSANYNYTPGDDPGWDYVGRMSNGTGIYLGDGWVLAPYHVYKHEAGHSSIELDRWYDEILGTARRIKFDTGTNADLVMFRINGNPNPYPDPVTGDPIPITIRSTGLSGSTSATIISTGRIRDDDGLQSWDIEGKTYEGFATTATFAKRWGRNFLYDYYGSVDSGGGCGQTDALWSKFDDGRNDEVQPVDKDSGGGAFVKVGSTWELAGMILLVGPNYPYPNEHGIMPGTHAIYGSDAFYADLSTYSSQIFVNRLCPLPGDADWNGRVDLMDFGMFRASFGQTGSNLRTDFNYDEVVDEGDLEILENNFGMVSGNGINFPFSAPPMAPVLVPEPATIFVLIGAVPLLLKSSTRRRRV